MSYTKRMRTQLILLTAAIIPATTIHSDNFVSCPVNPIVVNKTASVDPHEKKCLAVTIWGEARGEPVVGRQAVGYTALNRAVKKTVCAVVLAPKQYSVFNNSPALKAAAMSLVIDPHLKTSIDQKTWKEALQIAEDVLSRKVIDPVAGATNYLADKLMHQRGYSYPKWSKEYMQVASIGGHRFFKKREANPKQKVLTLAMR